jgi:hypothetical protein
MALNFGNLVKGGVVWIPLPPNGGAALDIGRSNVYDANPGQIAAWFRDRGAAVDDDWCQDYAARSGHDDTGKRLNSAFLSEVCDRISVRYRAFDIMEGTDVTAFDLNHDRVPDDLFEQFDLVLNLGTTEHVMNQFNAFRVIHDAVKVGGQRSKGTGSIDPGHRHYCALLEAQLGQVRRRDR